MTSPHDLRAWAQRAITRGYAIFPCRPGDKRPKASFKDARNQARTPEDVAHLWAPDTDANIGVLCGWNDVFQQHLVVLDVDRDPGGFDTLSELCAEYGALPETYTVNTPSGGKHYYFINEDNVRNSVGKLGPGLDTRGEGGYVVGEGSLTANGGYTLASEPQEPAFLPPWIAALLAAPDHGEMPAVSEVAVGGRNDALYKAASALRRNGLPVDAIRAAISALNDTLTHPLAQQEVNTLVESAGKHAPEAAPEHTSRQLAAAMGQGAEKPDAAAAKWNAMLLADLEQLDFPYRQPFVDNLLPKGLCILAGDPKAGKSWLAMQLSAAVSSGTPFFGMFETTRCPVLHLALEDSQERFTKHITKFDERDARNLWGVTSLSVRIGEGLEEQIDQWLLERPDGLSARALVVIDLLQAVKNQGSHSGGKTAYENDYNGLKSLRDYVSLRNVAIVVLHHTRKASSENEFNSISGSQGIAGSVDTIWLLKSRPNSFTGDLIVTSRESDGGEYEMERMERPKSGWNMIGEKIPEEQSVADRIRACLSVESLTTKELAKEVRSNVRHVQAILSDLFTHEEVVREREKVNRPYRYSLNPDKLPVESRAIDFLKSLRADDS